MKLIINQKLNINKQIPWIVEVLLFLIYERVEVFRLNHLLKSFN